MGKREEKREALKTGLIEAAKAIIEEEGVRGLNARNVTTRVGCALGSLYTAFEDLDDLIVHVNSQTLAQLGAVMAAEVASESEPEDVLKALARRYVKFARENYALWNALFEYADITMQEVPSWHQQEQALLIEFIKGPVMKLRPGIDPEEASIRARTLFAAVHGIVTFSMQSRYIGLQNDQLEPELMSFIDQMLHGLDNSA